MYIGDMFKILSGCICVSKVKMSRFIFQSQRELAGLGYPSIVKLTAGQEDSLFIDSIGNIYFSVLSAELFPRIF